MSGRAVVRRLRTALLFGCMLLAMRHPVVASPLNEAAPRSARQVVAAMFLVSSLALFTGKRGWAFEPAPFTLEDSPWLQQFTTDLPPQELKKYGEQLFKLKALLAFEPTFSRPAAAHIASHIKSDSRFIRPVDERLIRVIDDRLAHFNDAILVEPAAMEWRTHYVLPEACKKAISIMFDLRQRLPKWRRTRLESIRTIRNSLNSIDALLKSSNKMCESAANLEGKARQVHVGMVCLFCDALQHADVDIPANYLRGFPVSGIIPDSGVLRPLPPANTSVEEFWSKYQATMTTNADWAAELGRSMSSQVNFGSSSQKQMAAVVWDMTKKEIAAGYAGKPLTLRMLQQKYGSGVRMNCRVIKRHGVSQPKPERDSSGQVILDANGRPKMVNKVRLIDDCRRSLHNSHLQRRCETIAPCRFTYMASVCEEVAKQASDRNIRAPQVVFSLDDQKAAYRSPSYLLVRCVITTATDSRLHRQIPTREAGMCVVCVYSFDKGNEGPRFIEYWGHNFGNAAAVTNYYRTPVLCSQIARHFFAVPQEHYFDDFCTPDFKLGAELDSGANACITGIHDILGLKLEPTKNQPASTCNVFLGVECDLAHTRDEIPYVEFRPSSGRVDKVLTMLRQAATDGLTAAMASTIHGKLSWILQAAWGGVGRAALQPLVSRVGTTTYLLPGGRPPPPQTEVWTTSLQSMSDFLHVLLPGLPPLRWYLGSPAKRKLVVYSDAQFSTRGRNGVGVTIADTETGLRHTCGAEIPLDILDWIDTFGRKKTKINQCEMLAALVAVMTFPDLFRDRDVLFFVDNVSTLSACVHGYSARPEMGALSNAIHLMFANLGSRTFFQHVPGKANPADIPSRVPFVFDGTDMVLEDRLLNSKDRNTVLKINARHRPCVFPLREQLSDLEFFLQFGK